MEIIKAIFNNSILFGLVISMIFLLIFIVFWMTWTAPVTRVLLLGADEKRLDTIKINLETPKGLRSLSKKNPRRFFKYSSGWLEVSFGRRITNYIAKRGTAYTWYTKGLKEEKLGSFWDALEILWSDPNHQKLIKQIPVEAANILKSNDVYVTVNVAEGFTPNDFTALSEEDLATEGNKDMAQIFAEGAKGANKAALLPLLFAAGSGGLVVMIGFGLLGWLKIGG